MAVLFMIAALCCLLVATSGISIIVVATAAHTSMQEPSLGAIMASFVPAMTAMCLASVVGAELCVESGRCAVWSRKQGLQRMWNTRSVEMMTLKTDDFNDQSSASSSSSAVAVETSDDGL